MAPSARITDEVVESLALAAATGKSTAAMAAAAGVSEGSVKNWMARGRALMAAGAEPRTDLDGRCIDLAERVAAARSTSLATTERMTEVLRSCALIVREKYVTDSVTGESTLVESSMACRPNPAAVMAALGEGLAGVESSGVSA